MKESGRKEFRMPDGSILIIGSQEGQVYAQNAPGRLLLFTKEDEWTELPPGGRVPLPLSQVRAVWYGGPAGKSMGGAERGFSWAKAKAHLGLRGELQHIGWRYTPHPKGEERTTRRTPPGVAEEPTGKRVEDRQESFDGTFLPKQAAPEQGEAGQGHNLPSAEAWEHPAEPTGEDRMDTGAAQRAHGEETQVTVAGAEPMEPGPGAPFGAHFACSKWRYYAAPKGREGGCLEGTIYRQGKPAARAWAVPGPWGVNPPPWLKGFTLCLPDRGGMTWWMMLKSPEGKWWDREKAEEFLRQEAGFMG